MHSLLTVGQRARVCTRRHDLAVTASAAHQSLRRWQAAVPPRRPCLTVHNAALALLSLGASALLNDLLLDTHDGTAGVERAGGACCDSCREQGGGQGAVTESPGCKDASTYRCNMDSGQ